MSYIVKHLLKGTFRQVVDVSKILIMKPRKRMFMILDRDCPYELALEIRDPHHITSYALVGTVMVPFQIYVESKIVKTRFETKEAMEKEIELINEKKQEAMKETTN